MIVRVGRANILVRGLDGFPATTPYVWIKTAVEILASLALLLTNLAGRH